MPKATRKRLQIVNAPHKSLDAKLVKLADKLDNLMDLRVSPPTNWSQKQVQGYFLWARAVVRGLRGTNAELERQLDEVFASSMNFNGELIPCIPVGVEKQMLDQYYELMQDFEKNVEKKNVLAQ